MARAKCLVEDCTGTNHGQGYCGPHRYRFLRYGDPLQMGPRGTRGSIVAPLEVRFWAKVTKTETCWIYTTVSKGKYASVRDGDRTVLVHRLSYEWANGPIPEGMTIDHLCKVSRCVRPDHLEAVTVAENSSRASKGRRQRFCKRNHDQSIHRVERKGNGGYCGECARIRQRVLKGSLGVNALGPQDAQVVPSVGGRGEHHEAGDAALAGDLAVPVRAIVQRGSLDPQAAVADLLRGEMVEVSCAEDPGIRDWLVAKGLPLPPTVYLFWPSDLVAVGEADVEAAEV